MPESRVNYGNEGQLLGLVLRRMVRDKLGPAVKDLLGSEDFKKSFAGTRAEELQILLFSALQDACYSVTQDLIGKAEMKARSRSNSDRA